MAPNATSDRPQVQEDISKAHSQIETNYKMDSNISAQTQISCLRFTKENLHKTPCKIKRREQNVKTPSVKRLVKIPSTPKKKASQPRSCSKTPRRKLTFDL